MRSNHRGWLACATALVAGIALAAAASAAPPRVVKLKADDKMQYDVKLIDAKAGEQIKVQLTTVSNLPKTEMSHNFVLLAKGTNADNFAMMAAMARDTNYIPKGQEKSILAQTSLAAGGETVEVTFTAPKEPGEYMYLCTFPGHYIAGMKGKLVVK